VHLSKKGEGAVQSAVYATSKERASIAVPNGFATNTGHVVSDGTFTYLQKKGAANHAISVSTGKLTEILKKIQDSR
jgi:hypothetical protein